LTRLYLLRHAKAGWALPGMGDFDRPLNERGRSDALALGVRLRDLGHTVERTVCSGARRCRETLELVAQATDPGVVTHEDALYSANAAGYLSEIRRHGDAGSLMLVGHNPIMEDLTQALAGSGAKKVMKALADGFPTCGMAILRFPEGLAKAAPGEGEIEAFLTPSNA
jgi:phosphohistidine phosphatase